MKKKELITLREKTGKDLQNLVIEKKKEADLTFSKIKANQEKNTSKAQSIRRDIAQILSIIREKEIIDSEKNKEKIK